MALKNEVDDNYVPFIFGIFNALGRINLNSLGKGVSQVQCEAKQYLTLQSIEDNMHKVFGIKNKFFAEMLFSYISDHAEVTHKINFQQFFSRLMIFWPKKEIIPEYEDAASTEWRLRNA